MLKRRHFHTVFFLSLLLSATLLAGLVPSPARGQATEPSSATAVVLVNASSAHYLDFEHYIQPYLDNFGVPYIVHDIASAPVTSDVLDQALIIVGHNGLDESGTYLDSTEQALITAAVSAGAGLVNFDRLLADATYTPRYAFVQDTLDLTYGPSVAAGSVNIGEGAGGLRINCWEDDHQEPVLVTTGSIPDLENVTDGAWTEFEYGGRPYPSVMAGVDEEDYGLPVMRFYASEIPDGEYEVWANLYTSGSGRDARYFYGYTLAEPKAHFVDTVGGSGGSDQHTEYSLGTVTITDGDFEIYVQDADLTGSDDYPIFGWAWIRLVPEDFTPSPLHYITERHESGETIGLSASMTTVGMTPPADATVVATAADTPFIVVREYGMGKAVQWGSYDFTQVGVKGYVYGLDDLVWRSLVWAARKPFVMQGIPPLLPFRIDDCSGPYWWAEDAAAHGLKPWLGFFLHDMDADDTARMKALVDAGDATASVHALNYSDFFYFDHSAGADHSDALIADYYAEATQWHTDNEIPISTYVLGHFYELGTNVFDGLEDWGVEFIGTHQVIGTGYGAAWQMIGPYRRYVSGSSRSGAPVYYADYVTVPGHPEHDGKFFNVVTEIRDNAGYEWYPDNDVAYSIEKGIVQSERAFDSMVLATLFTHEQHIRGINRDNWNAILEGVLDGLAPYEPIYVTMDEAAQYVRAIHSSDIDVSTFDSHTGVLTTTLTGDADMPTQFYLFTECGADIYEERIDVPAFSGSVQVLTQLPGELHRIEVSPAAVTLGFEDQQQFVAQGYDVLDTPVICADYTWDVVNGGGTIDQTGVFTAGTTAGTFLDTVTASDQGITGTASVVVAAEPVDRFEFALVGDQIVGEPFTITITALDEGGLPVASYDGIATLTDTTGSMLPTTTGPFVNGVWQGQVTINQAASAVVITAQDVAPEGSSNPFTVTEPPPIPAYLVTSESYTQTAGISFTVTVSNVETTINLWEDDHQEPVLTTFYDSGLFNDGDGEWDEFKWSGRDYPAVFGGLNEAASGALETMHFYADVPNGVYRVVANLYRSRDWRYTWGYTPDDPRAYSFDVTSGTVGDFTEFEIDTITITDSHFDLYTNYAQDLGGTAFPYFGWAWIRLVPVLPETQINLWEDDHQDPILVTHSDPYALNATDGVWEEFLYTPVRPYPSILAGHDEWENNGLEPMHFFGDGIPNGIYEVWANLYTVRNTRYFYGFTEAEALAGTRSVDVAADTSGTQHTEYLLGTVEITDGHFDLWAGDGDILSGDPYFYGWAWIRLVANQLTMSASSPTMQFDGDGDGIFGEPGDEIGALVDGGFDIAAQDTTAGVGIVISATDSAGFWGRAAYTILPGELVSVTVAPPAVSLLPGEQQPFTATGFDLWHNPIQDLDFDWDVVNGGGVIDAAGVFTAGVLPGVFSDTVVATTAGLSDTASVTVTLIPADDFDVAFIYSPQYAGVPIEVRITALDGTGDPVTAYNGWPTVADTTGTLTPTTVGPFVDGVWQGYLTVEAVADDVEITVDDGLASGSSNTFDVTAMPSHVYAVSSDSYVQVVGSPFVVTVAPITYTIDLWEDANQIPVLATTTNSGDLVTTDGQWTEFHYESGGRPFPSVMAGADEEDYGLPTMHFYAVGIPDGTYEVIANLYTGGSGRDMRYFYGFTSDDPEAAFVDTVGGSGGADQHTEYSLGAVTLTDGRFDLYVRDAELLAGTYEIFGWAHVRLEPVFSDERINLWEDAHQDPVLATTTDPDDLVADDDAWTEFEYTGRGYPAVFASYDESPPLMRFYADDIPNGTYTLVANLYWSHNLRYTWGYTEADPEAYSYDVTSGNSGDFTEYVIDDAVTVTDNTFELYVQNADPLPGGIDYPFYGWAWVRLVPSGITMASNSPTMVFDGDGDGTFDEPEDTRHLMTGEPFTTLALDTAPGVGVLISATDDLGATGVASYTILDLDYITITPADVTLAPGGTQGFTAQAYDSLGDPVPDLVYEWSVVNGGGTIDATGLFTADTVSGVYPATVVAEYATVMGTANVTVTSGPPVALQWATVYSPQYAGVPFLADLYALDTYGNVAAGYNGVVDLSDTTSTLVPDTVTLVDGQWTGELRVDVEADNVTVSASDGNFAAATNPFDVLATPLQSYIVASDVYTHVAGEPFTVTVTAITSTINLWEDNHQRPVLTTFDDPLLFNQVDGAWDEFQWDQRDYPGVFGGIAEAVSGTLMPMHFYGVVPNGTYRVIANLYHSNGYRYFYGFEPDDVQAYSVDVGDGPTGDFAEFDLGTVTITDYRFDLYTDYAEVIVDRGAFPYFGWAWVRLVPEAETLDMQTSSPTMRFDGDDDGTFGEPGDEVGTLVGGTFDILAQDTTVGSGIIITATDAWGNWGNATYTIIHAPTAAIAVTPGVETVVAGQDVTYTTTASDAFGNTWDVTTHTTFVAPLEAGGAWLGNIYNSAIAGTWEMTGTYGAFVDTFILNVEHADAIVIDLDPAAEIVTAGNTVTYMVVAEDMFGNSWDVTTDTRFTIAAAAGGTWAGSVYTSELMGSWTVTGTLGALSDTAVLNVEHANPVSLMLSPAETYVVAGDAVTYQVTAQDAYSNSWTVTSSTIFSVASGAGGSWLDNVYTSAVAGTWTVSATYVDLTAEAILHVDHAVASAMTLTPTLTTLTAGESVRYLAVAQDVYGNAWDVTTETVLLIDPQAGGTWAGSVYTSAIAGTWTITGVYEALSATAMLQVNHGAAVTMVVSSDDAIVTAGDSITYTVIAEDAWGNPWDITAETAFSMPPEAGGTWLANVYTSAVRGDWPVTATYQSLSDTVTLHVIAGEIVRLDLLPNEATVYAGESVSYQALAVDDQDNTWDVTHQTSFVIEAAAGGIWAAHVYTSEVAGTWEVSGEYGDVTGMAQLHVEPVADLSLHKADAVDPAVLGIPLTYTLLVMNNGPSVAADVVLTDMLPSSVQLRQVDLSHGICDGESTVVCELGTIAKDEAVTLTFVVTPTLPGLITNTAHLSSSALDPDLVNNEAVEETLINNPVPLILTLDPDNVLVNAETFTLTVVGEGFVPGAQVLWDGVPLTTTMISSTQLEAVVLSMELTVERSVAVQVMNPTPGGGPSNSVPFVVIELGPEAPSLIYLPLVMVNKTVPAPDLIVEGVIIADNDVTIIVRNQGDAPVLEENEFWIDLYVDPDPPPAAVNDTWDDGRCLYGAVWGIGQDALPLGPGESLTLRLYDDYFQPMLSYLPDDLGGKAIYVHVDSANIATTHGAVLEGHEITGKAYNNIMGPVYTTGAVNLTTTELFEPTLGPVTIPDMPTRP